MAVTVLNEIAFRKDIEEIKKALHIKDHIKMSRRFDEMIEESGKIAKPKAVFSEAFVDIFGENTVYISGIEFKSRLMSSNLKNIGRVFAYAATCGTEINEWAEKFNNNPTDQYLADKVKELYLLEAENYVIEYVTNAYELGKSATMNPGSLPDWPISEQPKLLSIIGDVQKLIGITMTQSFLLVPMKSVSGIVFSSDVDFVNCKLCVKKNCIGRKAPFDAKMYKEKLGKT